MSNCTRIVNRVWKPRALKWGHPVKPKQRKATLYAATAPDGTRYLHNGDMVPVTLGYVAPFRARPPYVLPEDRRNPLGVRGRS